MPLQNRVTPFGELIRTSARGTFMGNRGGVLHRNKQIVRPFASRRWITCLLEFKGRRRVPMTENLYTELFFLDEATALAAGHRPCAECRRDRFNAFRQAWQRGRKLSTPPSAEEMDRELHPARIDSQGNKITTISPLSELPNGCFVALDAQPHLVWNDSLLLWTPAGYSGPSAPPPHTTVTVLTPTPIIDCLRYGYHLGELPILLL